MRRWELPGHRRVAEILGNLDAEFLRRANCYFGGGTQIVLANGTHEPETLRAGLSKAQAAYGAAVLDYLEKTARRLHDDRAWLRKCINDLMVDDEKGLRRGLRALLAFLPAGSKKSPPARPRSGTSG